MKINLSSLTLPTKLTVAALVGCAFAIWTQWLSGDPSYPKFPPGPVFFIAVAAIVAFGARWWWTPLIGSMIALLVTSGWFARLPRQMQRLAHPGSIGHFAPGIFLGTIGMIIFLLIADVAGLAATVVNYRSRKHATETSKIVLRSFGAIFVLMSVLVIASGLHADRYHNLMHLTWGALAIGTSFLAARVAKLFCIGSGLFYLTLAVLGLTIGDAAMGRAWQAGPMLLHTGDHVFHLVLGSVLLALAFVSVQERRAQEQHA
jgi:heme/copper-type cytochrome/quinol oxidase subunit 3